MSSRKPSDLPSNLPRPYTEFELLRENDFPQLVAKRFQVSEAKDAAEVLLKDINGTICGMLLACGMSSSDKVEVADVGAVQLIKGTTPSQLSEKKLLEAGVDPDIIRQCKTQGTEYWYIQRVKQK